MNTDNTLIFKTDTKYLVLDIIYIFRCIYVNVQCNVC